MTARLRARGPARKCGGYAWMRRHWSGCLARARGGAFQLSRETSKRGALSVLRERSLPLAATLCGAGRYAPRAWSRGDALK